MADIGPYSNYRLTARLELANKPGIFARVAAALAEEGANLGAVDIVSATKSRMVRDVTFDVHKEEHGEKVLGRLSALPDVTVLSASDRIFCASASPSNWDLSAKPLRYEVIRSKTVCVTLSGRPNFLMPTNSMSSP